MFSLLLLVVSMMNVPPAEGLLGFVAYKKDIGKATSFRCLFYITIR